MTIGFHNCYKKSILIQRVKMTNNITHKKISKATFIILIIMALCGFQFYGYYEISNNMQKFPCMLLIPLLFFVCRKQIFLKENDIFFQLIRYLLFSWLLSMIMSFLFWNQSMILSYRATAQSLFFIIFFYFCKIKVDVHSLEKIIIIFGWLYIILWLYAFSRAPEVIFGWSEEGFLSDDLSRGMVRVNFTGRLSLILGYFYYLNKCFIDRNPKYKIFTIIFFIFLVLQLTRQLILWAGVVTIIFMFMKAKKLVMILAILFVALYVGVSIIEFSDNRLIGAMVNVTNEQISGDLYQGEDPRITDYKYMFNDWSRNTITDIFGNGLPHYDSNYGIYEERLKQRGIYLSDVGYPSMYVILGIIGLALYIIIYIKGSFAKLPKELNYVNMFMLFLIPANIAARWYMGADTQLGLAICIYLIYTYRKEPKLLNLERNDI